MENPVENILKDKGERGLSLRQLTFLMGVNRRRVKYHIYNAKCVKDCEPFVHGSYKNKIRVFCYTPENRKFKKKQIELN